MKAKSTFVGNEVETLGTVDLVVVNGAEDKVDEGKGEEHSQEHAESAHALLDRQLTLDTMKVF